MRFSPVSTLLPCLALSGPIRSVAFAPPPVAPRPALVPTAASRRSAPFVVLRSTAEEKVVDEEIIVPKGAAASFDGAEEIEFLLLEHKPLGCTAEESLAVEEDGTKHVFISKVVEGGNADKAGIMAGDVVVGVTGTFDDVVNVAGLGIEKVRAYIAGRDPSQNLSIKVARGTDVMSLHESALVDLCTLPEKDVDLENCITSLNSYDMGFEEDAPTVDCGDDGAECMIDQLYSGWGEEMGLDVAKDDEAEEEETKADKPAPWSSRSSPSGTFVRDPKTGKMVNIDA